MLFVVALVAFLFPLAYSPGPGNMFFAALGARYRNRGYPAGQCRVSYRDAGGHRRCWAWDFVSAGTSRLLPFLWDLKLAGSVYVMWLAWKMATSGSTDTANAESARAGFLDGVMAASAQP
jgi:threonine/homoserine/homoserine lactone efflux protein